MWLSITAIIISLLSLTLSYIAYKKSKSIKHAEVNTEVLTKIRALEIEYFKLIREINDVYKIVEELTPKISTDILKEILKVKEYLEYTRSHYEFLLEPEYPISIETLEGIKHRIEALKMQTEFDKEKYKRIKLSLDEIVKTNNEILSIKKPN